MDFRQKMYCFITGNECNCDISPNVKEFFVGFKFESEYYHKDELKETITEAFKNYPVKPWFPDDNSEPEHLTVPICRTIRSTCISIFELSDQAPNVLIELGIAIGRGSIITILRNRSSNPVPTDIDGIYRIHYADVTELKGRLRNFISKIISKASENNPEFAKYIEEDRKDKFIKLLNVLSDETTPIHKYVKESLGISSEYLQSYNQDSLLSIDKEDKS